MQEDLAFLFRLLRNLRYLNWLKVKINPIQKFDYLKDNTNFNKTAKDEGFIPIRSRENEG